MSGVLLVIAIIVGGILWWIGRDWEREHRAPVSQWRPRPKQNDADGRLQVVELPETTSGYGPEQLSPDLEDSFQDRIRDSTQDNEHAVDSPAVRAEPTARADLFLLHAANRDLIDGTAFKVRWLGYQPGTESRSWLNSRVFIGCYGLVALVMAVISISMAVDMLLPYAFGKTTQAIVTAARQEGQDRYYVTVQFEISGRSELYAEEISVSKSIHDRHPVGSRIEVNYWPPKPSLCDVVGNPVAPFWYFWGLLTIMMVVIAVVLWRPARLRIPFRKSFAAEIEKVFFPVFPSLYLKKRGQVCYGHLVDWEVYFRRRAKSKHSFPEIEGYKYYWHVDLQYCFETPGGRTIRATRPLDLSDEPHWETNVPEIRVAVIYLSDDVYDLL
jgi:hypothetical protein